MSADVFLRGGLLFSLLWHLFFLVLLWSEWYSGPQLIRSFLEENLFPLALNIGLSGVALCGFGYLLFS